MKIMPGLSAIIGRTDAEAEENYEYLNSLVHPIVAREILSTVLGNVDLTPYPFDGPLPENLPLSNASQGIFQSGHRDGAATKSSPSGRSRCGSPARAAKAVVRGSPQTVADYMEEWFSNDGCDGFNIMPPFLPGGLDDFVDLVIPELQRRGLFRTEYEGKTLARESRSRSADEPLCRSRAAAVAAASGG